MPRILVSGIKYALDSYMKNHGDALKLFGHVELYCIEDIIPFYDRRSGSNLLREIILFNKKISSLNVDVIISVGPKVGFLSSCAKLFVGCKHIHWFTGQPWSTSFLPQLTLSWWIDLFILLGSNAIIFDGPSQKKFFLGFFPFSLFRNAFTTPNGSISCVNSSLLSAGCSYLSSLESPESSSVFVIGYLGRLCYDKGLDIILRLASEDVFTKNFKFLIRGPLDTHIGRKNYSKYGSNSLSNFDSIIESLTHLPNVDIETSHCDPIEFFTKIDLFLLPSRREGFGLAAIEAQACARPVVCSDIYGLRDSVIHSKTGYKCQDYEAYVHAINLLRNPFVYKSFSREAYVHACFYAESVFNVDLSLLYRKVFASLHLFLAK